MNLHRELLRRLSMGQQFAALSLVLVVLAAMLICAVAARSTYAIALERARTAAALILDSRLQADDQAGQGASLAANRRADRLGFAVSFDMADAVPTQFELEAREAIGKAAGQEYFRVAGSSLLYARRFASGSDAGPSSSSGARHNDVTSLAGTLTVVVPLFEPGHSAVQFFGWPLLLGFAAFALAIAAVVWFISHEVIAPIQRLCRRAERVSEADVANINAEALRFTDRVSNNDLHRLDAAIKRLLRSIRIQRSY